MYSHSGASLCIFDTITSSPPCLAQIFSWMCWNVRWNVRRTWCPTLEASLWRNLSPQCTTTSSFPIINVWNPTKEASPNYAWNSFLIWFYSMLCSKRCQKCSSLRRQLHAVWPQRPGDAAKRGVLPFLPRAVGPQRPGLPTSACKETSPAPAGLRSLNQKVFTV